LGNVTVQTNAALFVTSSSGNTAIEGNVSANGCDKVQITSLVGLGPRRDRRQRHNSELYGERPKRSRRQWTLPSPPRVLIGGNASATTMSAVAGWHTSSSAQTSSARATASVPLKAIVVADNVTVNNKLRDRATHRWQRHRPRLEMHRQYDPRLPAATIWSQEIRLDSAAACELLQMDRTPRSARSCVDHK
jgi:hypothetical protein